MKKAAKFIGLAISSLLVFILILLGVYIIANRQGVIERESYGSPDSDHTILIASQGSKFKQELVTKLVDELVCDSISIVISDCTKLASEKTNNWAAIIMIYATQIHGMPQAAEEFIQKIDDPSKMIIISTSGSGDEIPAYTGCDAISTASRMSILEQVFQICISKVKPMLIP